MKKFFFLLLPFVSFFGVLYPSYAIDNPSVHIRSGCSLNGQPVDCSQITGEDMDNIFKYTFGFISIIFALVGISSIFWLVMFIHALSNPIPDKALWICAMLFLSIFGAVAYYFVVKRKLKTILVPKDNPGISTASPVPSPTQPSDISNPSI